MDQTTLSHRGIKLAEGPNLREMFSSVLSDPYHPQKNPNGFVNMGTSENYIMIPEVVDFINKNVHLENTAMTYGEGPWGTLRLRKAMARHMDNYMKTIVPVDPELVIFTNGVTSVCEMLGFTLADQGDGILFSRPIYQAFQVDFGTKAKLEPVFTTFGDDDQFSTDCVSRYEGALLQAQERGVKVRALMLCNPHNPLGQCYPKETIIALMKFCDKYKIHLLSDEIYAASVYDVPDKHARKFTSVLSFDYTPYIHPDFVHVLYGMSKDFAGGGLRLGCIYIRNKELARAMNSFTQFHWAGGPSQAIATLILENEDWLENFLEQSRTALAAANKTCRSRLDDAKIHYRAGANAGFFLWLDLRRFLPKDVDTSKDAFAGEKALAKKFMEEKVLLTGGEALSSEEPGFFRLIFSQSPEAIEEGFRRIMAVLNGN